MKKNYFKRSETQCKCGCGLDITDDFRTFLNMLREACGRPLYITSGARCRKYNATRKNSAKNSKHIKRIAADIRARTGWEKNQIIRMACRIADVSFSDYPTFVHIDLRTTRPTTW